MTPLGVLTSLAVGGTLVALAWPSSRRRTPDPTRPEPTPDPEPPTVDPEPPTVDPGDARDAFGVLYLPASGDPLWPLPDDRRSATPRGSWARGRVSADFGDARPYGSSSPARHHAGEDLRAPRGSAVVAMERGTIVAIDEDWYEGTGALLVYVEALDATVNYGEVEPGSTVELGLGVGSVVERGETIGRVGRTDMLHLEVYAGEHRRTYRWPWQGAAPLPLLDPTRWLELAASTVPA